MIHFLGALLTSMYLLIGCNGQEKEDTKVRKIQVGHLYNYKDIFGEKFYAMGVFSGTNSDSIETKLWYYTNLDRPLVLYGNFLNGLPIGDWMFTLDNGTLMSSKWAIYKNNTTACIFSLPFSYEETFVDSNYFKLTTFNDSLGKVSIIVGVRGAVIKEKDLDRFGPHSEIGLTQQGYTFTRSRREIDKGAARYFFTEYFLKDSLNKDAKLYNVYGYCPSRKHFIEFSLFHSGAKEDLVKMIFDLIVTNLFVDDERFLNPFIN